ncbi:hypothetical protein SAMN03159495_4619 [Pseudomonas sp. NFR16]|nr:hypothetical protein SAMN03159495_4619 [Pseudomonas sp. NFR16]
MTTRVRLAILSLFINILLDDLTHFFAPLAAKFACRPSGCARADNYARIQAFSASQYSNNNFTNAI